MHIRKKRKFNAVIINKFDMIFLLLIIVSLCIPIYNSKLLNTYCKNILTDAIPSINSTNRADYNKKSIIATGHVLAAGLPLEYEEELNEKDVEVNDSIKEIVIFDTPTHEVRKTYNFNEQTLNNIITTCNNSNNLTLKNETTYQPDVYSLVNEKLSFENPEILIVHTHGSESYQLDVPGYDNDYTRTIDKNYNVIRVGEELAKSLGEYGFKVTHATDINDTPSYNQSYKKTLDVINQHLSSNKNIKIVLDIHRDAIEDEDGTKYKFISDVGNESVAQVMLVCGTDQSGLNHPDWRENLKFALKLQKYMETNYPGLARPLNLRQERFNTHCTPGSMIIEIGTNGNTLDEALASVKYLSKTIKEVAKPNG